MIKLTQIDFQECALKYIFIDGKLAENTYMLN